MKNYQRLLYSFLLICALSTAAHAYYDPAQGRWLSRDPIGEQGGDNLYGFVDNDGVNKSDILGMKYSEVPNDGGPMSMLSSKSQFSDVNFLEEVKELAKQIGEIKDPTGNDCFDVVVDLRSMDKKRLESYLDASKKDDLILFAGHGSDTTKEKIPLDGTKSTKYIGLKDGWAATSIIQGGKEMFTFACYHPPDWNNRTTSDAIRNEILKRLTLIDKLERKKCSKTICEEKRKFILVGGPHDSSVIGNYVVK